MKRCLFCGGVLRTPVEQGVVIVSGRSKRDTLQLRDEKNEELIRAPWMYGVCRCMSVYVGVCPHSFPRSPWNEKLRPPSSPCLALLLLIPR